MSISIEAYSPADGSAIVRKDGHLQLLRPPYKLGNEVNTSKLPDEERVIEEAVLRHDFYVSDRFFDDWNAVFAFLRKELLEYRVKRGHPVPESINGIEILNAMPERTLQKFLDKVNSEQIPHQQYEQARNFLLNLLDSNAIRDYEGLETQARQLLEQIDIAEKKNNLQIAPEIEKNLQESVEHLSQSAQIQFLNWLKNGAEQKQWDIQEVFDILKYEPLEFFSDEVIINIAAQVLKSSVILLDALNCRNLLKNLNTTLKDFHKNVSWDNVFFDLAEKLKLAEWAVESLPKLFIIINENNNKIIIRIWYFLAFFIKGDFKITKTKTQFIVNLEITPEIFKANKSILKEIEKAVCNNPFPSASGRKTVKLHILTNNPTTFKDSDLYKLLEKIKITKPERIDETIEEELVSNYLKGNNIGLEEQKKVVLLSILKKEKKIELINKSDLTIDRKEKLKMMAA